MGTFSPVQRGVIEAQAERILASNQFAETTRLNRFLSYVVEQSLAGEADKLKGYTLGVDVFDRPDDFDPTTDTIVRVQAGKLRQRLDLYYADEGRDDPVRIRIPKGHYAPIFELSFDADSEENIASIDAVPAAVSATDPSIAVLPFDNLSGDPSQEFFADGITEEILTQLTKFRELRVISRHSTFAYKNKPKDIRIIGKELGVQFVLEGSVRRWEDNIRVTMQLIRADDGSHLISENYDRELSAGNLFEIQDDIASHVSAEIAEPHGVLSRVGGRNQRWQTDNLDAYECRLAASEYWRHPTVEVHKEIRDRLEQAVALDPEYASAWAMLSIMYGDEVRGGFNFRAEPPPLNRALEAALKATDLDPSDATGFHAMFLTHFHRGEFDQFQAAANKAVRLNPNYPDMLADLGVCTALAGDWESGLALVQRATDLSPNPPSWFNVVPAVNHYRLHEYTAALESARLIGDSIWHQMGVMFELMILGQLGRTEEFRSIVDGLLEIAPDLPAVILDLLAPWHIPPELVAHMVDGWRKAGLDIKE